MENATTTVYRTELRKKILECAGQRFKKYGIKQVRMDDIAHSLGISKRTLYEVYPNKEELLLECLRAYHENSLKELHATIGEDWNVMDVICLIYRRQIELSMSVSPLFYDEMKSYNKVTQFLADVRTQQMESAHAFFCRGVEEGYFIDTLNNELTQELSSCINDYIRHNRLYFRYSMAEIFHHCIILFIRSVCTPKGIAELDRVLNAVRNNDNNDSNA